MPLKLPKKPESNSAVLVAGAAGFLGSHLIDTLIATGAKIIAIDDFTTGAPANIEHFKKHPNFNFIEASINETLPKSLYHEPISHIVHVANIETYLGQEKLELNRLLANSFGVKNLLDLAVAGKSTFLFTSSIDIYAGLASKTSLEHYYDGAETEAHFSYLEAKRYAEALCQQYVDLYDLDIRIARLSEVYGPRMNLDTNSLIARLIRLTLQGKDLIIDEEGSREHILCFISDVAFGLNKLLFSDKPEVQKSIFYFANPERVSTLSIAYTLRECAQKQIKVEFMPAKKPFLPIRTREVDITRARRELYWEPKIDITEGLRLTLEWFKERKVTEKKGLSRKMEGFVPTGTQEIEEIQAAQVKEIKKKVGKQLKKPAVEGPKVKLLKKPSFLQRLRSRRQPARRSPPLADEGGPPTTNHPPYAEASGGRQPPTTPPTLKLRGADNHQPAKGWLSLIKKPFPQKEFTLKGIESIEGKERKIKKYLKLAAIFVVVVLLFGPPLLTFVFAGKTFFDLNQVKDAVLSQNSPSASWRTQKNLGEAQTNLLRTQKNLRRSRYLLTLFGQNQRVIEVDKVLTAFFFALDAAKTGSDALFAVGKTLNTVKSLSPLFGGAPVTDKQKIDFADDSLNLRLASKRFSLAAQEISQINEDKLCLGNFFGCREKLKKVKENTKLLKNYLEISDDALLHFPKMLGQDGPKRYLILLQNNTELRATGGFLGSYATFTFDNTSLDNLKVNDIYNPDGILQQKITAPEAVKKYMDVNELGIRDSNWWPHFPESAEKIATLYEFATGDKVNFVIALNLDVVKNLLTAVGPIELAKYNETITANNLFERAEVHSEVGFTPGSTQKQDFLGNLADELIEKLAKPENNQFLEVAKALTKSLLQKEILLYARDKDIESIFVDAGFAGNITETNGDFLLVVDSNVGGNKSNFWVTRSTNYELFVDRDGNLTADLTISWNHTGTSATWPGGDYKNYLRVYVPKGASLLEESGFADTPGVNEEFGKTIFAGLVEVSINSTHLVHLKYALPKEIGFAEKDAYSLLVQKQSGIASELFSFKLTLPVFLKTIEGNSEIIKQIVLNQDQKLEIKTQR